MSTLGDIWLVPPWLMFVLAGAACLLLVRRGARLHNLMAFGAAVPRLYIAFVYLYSWLDSPPEAMRIAMLRQGLFLLLGVEVFYHLLRLWARRERNGMDL